MAESAELSRKVGRRGMILGAGAGTVIAAGASFPDVAVAAAPGSEGVAPAPRDGSPITDTIASAPQPGVVYRTVTMYDFDPFNPAGQKTWGGSGVYSAGTGTTMRARIDIPPGALVEEVEYYVYNNSGGSVFPDTYLYVPGHGAISSIGAGATVASTGTITANRVVVPTTSNGPYPSGARLLASLSTPSDGSVQINGARVGYRHGAGTVGVLQKPVKLASLKLGGGHVHTIALPTSLRSPGVVGVQVSMVATSATKAGTLTAWASGTTRPTQPVLYFPANGGGVAESVVVPLDANGTFKVIASRTVHLTVMAYEVIS